MNARLVLSGLFIFSFHRAALAQEFLGAEKALERIATETAKSKAEQRKGEPNEGWLARAEEFAKITPTLPAKDAAARWLALADEWRALPSDPFSIVTMGGSGQRGVFALVKSLPPPVAWDALDDAVSARPHEGDNALFNRALKLLTSGLRGESGKMDAAAKELADAGKKVRHGRSSLSSLKKVSDWIDAHRDEPKAAVARFEETLKNYESGDEEGTLEVPDLVTLAGAGKAAALLKRTLLTGSDDIRIETGDATRALAVKIATSLAPRLKKPPWDLMRGSSPAENALYEALTKKFPRKESDDNDGSGDRDSAEVYYIIGLIETKRTAEAAKLALARAARDGDDARFGDTVESMTHAASVKPMRAFLRELLAKSPALPFWPDFISLSAQASESADALAFLRATATREGLPSEAREHIRQHLWTALLAADEVDEGVRLLRETLDAKLAKIEANPAAAKKAAVRSRYGGTNLDDPGQLALRLARIGRLLEKPDLVEAGMKALRAAINAGAQSSGCSPSLPFQAATLLSDLGRGAEAETVLLDDLISCARKHPADPTNFMNSGDFLTESTRLSALAAVYHRAGRHDDVLALLNTAKGWSADDLAKLPDLIFEESTPLAYVAASALAANGRNDEARKIVLDLLVDHPGFDPAYELLLRLGGDDLIATLDAIFARDRFEERPLIWKAKFQLDAGRFDEAEKTVRAAIAIDPSDGEQGKGTRMRAYAVLGDILEKQGDDTQAKIMRGVVAAIRLSENADDWWQAGLLMRAARMYEESLGHFADAYCIQSRLALRYADIGNFAKAEEHYRRAFELMPESFGRIESHCFGCEGAFSGERAQGIAEKVFTQFAEKTPGKPQVFYLLGYLREEQERYAEAVKNYRKAVSLDPDYFNAWSKLGALSTHLALPHADREAAALNMLRLDPLGRHRDKFYSAFFNNSDSTISEIGDFRVLWKMAEDAAKLAPERAAELFPLPAANEEVERRKRAAAETRRMFGGLDFDEMGRRNNTPRTPGAMLIRHEFIASIARLLQEMAQAN